MPPKRYRSFSREFKEAAVRRVLAGEKVRAVARELQVVPKLIYHWWHRYEEGGAGALRTAGRPAARHRRPPDEATSAARIAELERKVGQQALELDFFARALRHLEASAPPSDGRGAGASSP